MTTTTQKTPAQILEALAHATGSENLYRHWLGIRYTDGVLMMAELCGAHWLIDLIASHQPAVRRKTSDRGAFQVWNLDVNQKKSEALAYCHSDSCDAGPSHYKCKPPARQKIGYTDFPLDTIKFYLVDGVLMLPSEY